jgi:hypothetical protein
MDTSTWVPLVTAAAGLIAGLAAGLVSTVLARRWAREDRLAQWQREDSVRWHQDRQRTYARFMAALYEWDDKLDSARLIRQIDETANRYSELDSAGIEEAREAALEQWPLVQFMAPRRTSVLASAALIARRDLWMDLSAEVIDMHNIRAESAKVRATMSALQEAMRDDLGLEIAIGDTGG